MIGMYGSKHYICGSAGILFGYLSMCYSWMSVYGLFDLSGRSVLFQPERWVYFLLYVFVERTSLVIRRMISATEGTSDITRSFFFSCIGLSSGHLHI
jgi:hypothetical protein